MAMFRAGPSGDGMAEWSVRAVSLGPFVKISEMEKPCRNGPWLCAFRFRPAIRKEARPASRGSEEHPEGKKKAALHQETALLKIT